METATLRTERLVLRPWRKSDLEPFAALNADHVVMEHFAHPLTAAETADFVSRIEDRFATSGWGLWAVEVTDRAPFIGYVGLWPADHVEPGAVEVGWRLAHGAWGHGYAPEAAAEVLRFGFEDVGLEEIVSFTTTDNANSRRVMEKIGLHREPSRDFDHPRVDPGRHPHLVRHIFHALGRDEWLAGEQ